MTGLRGSDQDVWRKMRTAADRAAAIRMFIARRRRYFVLGILFAVGVMIAVWFELYFVWIPCLFFSIMFFISSLHYDSYVKLLLILESMKE